MVEEPCSDHTLVQRLAEWRDAHRETHATEARERDTVKQALERRLDGMNEFRAALSDQQRTSVSRELFDQLVSRVASVERLVPIVALLSAGISAAITAAIMRAMGT